MAKRLYLHKCGAVMSIRKLVIDRNHRPDLFDQMLMTMDRSKIIGVVGAKSFDAPIMVMAKRKERPEDASWGIDPTYSFVRAGVSMLKLELFGDLNLRQPDGHDVPPGWIACRWSSRRPRGGTTLSVISAGISIVGWVRTPIAGVRTHFPAVGPRRVRTRCGLGVHDGGDGRFRLRGLCAATLRDAGVLFPKPVREIGVDRASGRAATAMRSLSALRTALSETPRLSPYCLRERPIAGVYPLRSDAWMM